MCVPASKEVLILCLLIVGLALAFLQSLQYFHEALSCRFVSMFCSSVIPKRGMPKTRFDALSEFVHNRQVVLSDRIMLIGRPAIPQHCTSIILRCTTP
jgi:hypothetical protein